MSFLKQILSPFIEFDEKSSQKTETKPNAPVPAPRSINRSPDPVPDDVNTTHPLVDAPGAIKERVDQLPGYSPSGNIDKPLPEHIEYFERLINDANASNPLFRGADYKEFIDSKLDIDDIADESLKYRTAFNILAGAGLTKDKLMQTGQEYIELIGRDLNTFQAAYTNQYKKEVGQNEKEIQKKAQELQALQQKVNTLKSEINKLTYEINVTRDKLSTVKNSFLLAGELKQNEIAGELKNIDKYF